MQTAELRQEHVAFQATLYESGNPTRRWLHNARRDWVLAALRAVSPAAPHYLEIGIGCGIYTRWMAAHGTVTACDINTTFVDAANALHNVTAHVADITQAAFPPVHDVAVCSEVVEHVPDSRAALANIHASLKPGGYLILTTPNAYGTMELMARLLAFPVVVRLARCVYGESVDDLGHINRLTRGALRQQLSAAGFQFVRQANVALYLPVVAEFGGHLGMRVCRALAAWMAKSSLLSHLLWTQCWIVRRPE